MFYIIKNNNGHVIDLLRDDYTAIPNDAILISDADGELLRHGFNRYQYIDGVVSINPAVAIASAQAEITATAKAALLAIDISSIRACREWIAAQPTAPAIQKAWESAAIIERAKL